MKLSNLLIILCSWLPGLGLAQLSPDKTLPTKKIVLPEPYLFPIKPGKQNALAGTMGELRQTHLHSGIDIRTDNMVGMPVQATQKGYINRIIVGTFGYGQALFVKHPDGNESVYGHLDHFTKEVAQFVLNKQYEKKSFDLDVVLAPGQFPVNRGDTVAFSGNTGASGGPHLHFEIRDDYNQALNPLDFSFSEINDVLAPVVQKIAFRTLNEQARVDQQYGRKEYHLSKNGNDYYVNQPVYASGKIGLEMLAYDRLDYSGFRCGINEIEVRVDSQRVFVQKIDKVDFLKNRQMASIIDYPVLKTRGLQFYKLYLNEGNILPYYGTKNNGQILVTNQKLNVEIFLRDSFGNTSRVHVTLAPSTNNTQLFTGSGRLSPAHFSIEENVLHLSVPCGQQAITLFEKGTPKNLAPTYITQTGQADYLIDLQRSIPDSATTCSEKIRFNIQDVIPPGIDYTYYSDWAVLRFTPQSLYDTLFIEQSKSKKNGLNVYTIGNSLYPLRSEIEISLKPETEKTMLNSSVYRINGRSYEYRGGQWDNGNIKFKTNELGEFILLTDSTAPYIHRIHCNPGSARFRIMDNLSGINSFQASINGQWLLMKYDYKTGIIQSERLDKTQPLKGNFELKVTDRAGNERTYQQKIY